MSKPLSANSAVEIRARTVATCVACGMAGEILYTELEDRLFHVPGRWNIRRCKNKSCGMLWLDPMPIEEDSTKLYGNRYYTHANDAPRQLPGLRRFYTRVLDGYLAWRYGYAQPRQRLISRLLGILLWAHGGHRAEADASVMFLPAQPGGKLLEIGFGGGESLTRFRDLGWVVTGIDADPLVVELMVARGFDVRRGSLSSQSFATGSFDVVVMSHVFEHLADPRRTLRDVWNVLKPGGTFAACLPNVRAIGHALFKKDWCGLDPPRHFYVYSADALRRLVQEAGFTVVRCGSTGRGAGLLMTSLMLRLYGRLRPWHVGTKLLVLEFARVFEWLIQSLAPARGEELVVVAKKELK